MPMTRKDAVLMAKRIHSRSRSVLPADGQMVVIVTDAAGDWVGVSSTEPDARTADILQAALSGASYRAHKAIMDVLDPEPTH